ncbi:MAG: CBS domain-containing protein [Candidatus Aquirickettsiella gammari]|uniref:Magnesium and cobalt efflux protein CorC n=1 Tax=Candidatus Aquirickettsiella gammari TaxID=2016198 RepID=A0A370CLX2_9COXI|nr:MAG: CBS domain-containing protein [Candidatus Aquirickettsiella gammari]
MKIPTSDDKNTIKKNRQPWLMRVHQALRHGPKDRKQLIELLQLAKQRNLLNAQALKMLEGVLQISDIHVRNIMVPHAKITVISENANLTELLPIVIESGHSRFPVINEARRVIGLLLAKDLLKYNPLAHQNTFDIRDIIRPAVFIPESKRLDSLLEEFQHKHYHMAIVVDEYGAVSGLVTIEDVLEEIVGEIEDEYDANNEVFVQEQNPNQFIVKAMMPIEAFNIFFNSHLTTEQFDTIGGVIANRFGYLPKRGASITLAPFRFKVLRADNRLIRLLQVNIEKPN